MIYLIQVLLTLYITLFNLGQYVSISLSNAKWAMTCYLVSIYWSYIQNCSHHFVSQQPKEFPMHCTQANGSFYLFIVSFVETYEHTVNREDFVLTSLTFSRSNSSEVQTLDKLKKKEWKFYSSEFPFPKKSFQKSKKSPVKSEFHSFRSGHNDHSSKQSGHCRHP